MVKFRGKGRLYILVDIKELSSLDWKVYKYIKRHPNVTKTLLVEKFGFAAEARITKLLFSGMIIVNGWEKVIKEVMDTEETKDMILQQPKQEYCINEDNLRHYEDYVWLSTRNGIQFWVPLGITAAISLGALIVSIIALVSGSVALHR